MYKRQAEQAGRTVGRSRRFSRQTELNDGVFLRGEDIVCRSEAGERVIMNTSDIKIPGVHNVENLSLIHIFMAGGVIVEEGTPEEVMVNTREERTRQFLGRYQR